MKLYKIFIICALVHAHHIFGAHRTPQKQKSIGNRAQKQRPAASASKQAYSPTLTKQFYKMVETRNPAALSFLKQYKALIDVNYQDKETKHTPLILAAANYDVALTKLLLENKADCQVVNKWNENALAAIFQYNLSVDSFEKSNTLADLLINAKANVNQQIEHDETLLMAAAGTGCSPLVSKLLKRGADMTIQTKAGTTFKPNAYSRHPFIPGGAPKQNALQIAQLYKQHAPTFADRTVGHHMVEILTKHKKRTKDLESLRDLGIPRDLIWLVGQYRGIEKKYSDY